MKITAELVTSAASSADFPRDGLQEVALVGRSNVGKSSLINALVRQRLARTSAAPGKTRLVNIYRIARGSAAPFYLVDLPGYGYARGGSESAREFDELTQAYFARVRLKADTTSDRSVRLQGTRGHAEAAAVRSRGEAWGWGPTGNSRGRESTLEAEGGRSRGEAWGWGPTPVKKVSALLLVDARHPGLASDRAAWQWMQAAGEGAAAVVATKIDKLARGERIRATRDLESVFENSVLPISVVTGEGLDELWKLIDRLANSNSPLRDSSPAAKVPPRPRKKASRPQRKTTRPRKK